MRRLAEAAGIIPQTTAKGTIPDPAVAAHQGRDGIIPLNNRKGAIPDTRIRIGEVRGAIPGVKAAVATAGPTETVVAGTTTAGAEAPAGGGSDSTWISDYPKM